MLRTRSVPHRLEIKHQKCTIFVLGGGYPFDGEYQLFALSFNVHNTSCLLVRNNKWRFSLLLLGFLSLSLSLSLLSVVVYELFVLCSLVWLLKSCPPLRPFFYAARVFDDFLLKRGE